jgi:hypothetical protein
MADEIKAPRAARAARRTRKTIVPEAVEAVVAAADAPVSAEQVVTITRDVVSAFTALESATLEARSKSHPLTLRRTGQGKFVATCSRCELDLPVLDTARGWTYPTLSECPNPRQSAS